MKIISLLFIFFSTFLSGSQTQEVCYKQLSEQQKAVVKIFLSTLIKDSEAGFVFFDRKPICIHGYLFKDDFSVSNATHREMVAVKEGVSIWQRLKKADSNIIIHITQKEDPQLSQFKHILVINLTLFHQAVNENLSLFQYVLGPAITSSKLLEALIVEDQPFHALLKYDKVLIGILLGFGTENSLCVSRIENLDAARENLYPPFLPTLLLQKEYNQEFIPLFPSYGFKSTKDELEALSKKVAISSEKLLKKPSFIFGWLKDDNNNKRCISNLEEAQAQVQKLILNDNYEYQILAKLLDVQSSGETKVVNSLGMDLDINLVLAKGIWDSLTPFDRTYLIFFLEGLDNSASRELKVDGRAFFSNYLSDFIQAKENLKKANVYFQMLDANKDFICVKPSKLYYRVLSKGDIQRKSNSGSLLLLTYSMYSPEEHCITHDSRKVINLKNTIVGFSLGVNGMEIGETREIYIHPSLTYEFDDVANEKCTYLKAVVTMHDILEANSSLDFSSFNLNFLLEDDMMKRREEEYKNGLRVKAAIIASHLKMNKRLDLAKIKEYLLAFSKSEDDVVTNLIEQDFINHVHWNIYFYGGAK